MQNLFYMETTTETLLKKKRRFLPEDFQIKSWEALEPFLVNLRDRDIKSVQDLENWILDRSELEAVAEEETGWAYIRMNIDTTDQSLADKFLFYVNEIQPKVAPFDNELNKKLIESEYCAQLDNDKYFVVLRSIRKQLEIFRDENIPLERDVQEEQQKFGSISAVQTITYNGEEMTMQKGSLFMKKTDRSIRETVYNLLKARRQEDVQKLNDLYTHLTQLRNKIALNAGFKNYRDYKFAELGRFDYTVQDCFDFHEAIAQEIVPVMREFDLERKAELKLDSLKPWDLEVDKSGKAPLSVTPDGNELADKTIALFYRLRPYFAECLEIMKAKGRLDLESKKGKAPGGFNYPLYETTAPFIYMNSVGSFRDMITMVHEGGHAVHSFLSGSLPVTQMKSLPSEVAELASMGMELLTMDNWDIFFENEDDLRRAKKEHLEKVLHIFPWVATIDKFQHWVYENPEHTLAEREAAWLSILDKFDTGVVDWTGNEDARATMWQKQLHLFEVPFYYVEYAIAQLGAIALWKNYKSDPQKTIDNYMAALSLGYSRPIREIYETAGISFNFSKEYVHELTVFVKEELTKI